MKDYFDFHGQESKSIVWEHNTRTGDARATNIYSIGMVNIGQLVLEKFGKEATILLYILPKPSHYIRFLGNPTTQKSRKPIRGRFNKTNVDKLSQ